MEKFSKKQKVRNAFFDFIGMSALYIILIVPAFIVIGLITFFAIKF